MSNLQECRASASPLGRDPAQALSEQARTNTLFPGGSRPTAKEQLRPGSAPAKGALGMLSSRPGEPGACCPLPGSPPASVLPHTPLAPHAGHPYNTSPQTTLWGDPRAPDLVLKDLRINLALSLTGCVTLEYHYTLSLSFLIYRMDITVPYELL